MTLTNYSNIVSNLSKMYIITFFFEITQVGCMPSVIFFSYGLPKAFKVLLPLFALMSLLTLWFTPDFLLYFYSPNGNNEGRDKEGSAPGLWSS